MQRSFAYLVTGEQQLMQSLRRRNEDLLQTLDTLRQTRSELSVAVRVGTTGQSQSMDEMPRPVMTVVVAIATFLAYRVAERERGLKSRELF